MEELSRQLRAEINALQDYILRLEDRFLVTTWTSQLLEPLERLEGGLSQVDLQAIVVLLQRVRDQFSINGQLAPRISEILARYPQYLDTAVPHSVAAEPALDPAPAGTAGEDEEKPEAHAAEPAAPQRSRPSPPPRPIRPARAATEESEDLSGLSIDVFTGRGKSTRTPPRDEGPRESCPSPSTLNLFPLGEKKRRPTTDKITVSPRQDLFISHKIRPADLKSKMQVSLPSQEQVQLDFKLQKKMSSRLVDILREQAEAGSLILIPRITQFAYQGTIHPCTAKVLITLFRPLLGTIQDWAPYRSCPFMDETPEAGWALVAPEALPDSEGQTYFEQQQQLRQRAETLGVMPRMVRRRTLVEALYDLITAQLVLGLRLNQRTLDTTASGPTANDAVCIYYSSEGIRVKDLPRTASHPALGVCPSL